MRPIERLAQNLYISPPYLSQVAALAAFDASEELEAVKAGYARNRAMLLEELPRIGFAEMHPVDGAFYIYADVARFTNDSIGFCRRMLEEAGVAATPGSISTAPRARITCASPSPARRRIAARRCGGCRDG